MRRRPRPVRLVGCLLVAVGLGAGGCGGELPTRDGVHVVRRVTAEDAYEGPQVRKVPVGPVAGASPAQVVQGFLEAAAGQEDDPAVARMFLAPGARWDGDGGVTVYDPSQRRTLTSDDGRSVTVEVPRVAVVDPDGGYRPTTARVRRTYRLIRVDGQWRLSGQVPPGMMLTERDVQRDFEAATVYQLGRDGDVLVPDRVQLPVVRTALPGALVRALLRGPTSWLAPAARSHRPPGAQLLDSATLVDGTVTVNLSREITTLPAPEWAKVQAQLAATLDPLPSVERVLLLVEGRRVLTGDGTIPPQAPAAFDADTPETGPVYAAVDGRVRRLGEPPARRPEPPGPAAVPAPGGLSAPAVSPDGTVAALRRTPGGTEVVLGPPEQLRVVARVGDVTAPSWLRRTGAVVARRGERPEVLVVPADGGPAALARTPGLGRAGPVADLRISRDGARVALVAGWPGSRTLRLGRVGDDQGAVVFDGWEQVTLPPTLADVTAVAWQDGLTLVVLGRQRDGPALWKVSLDGSTPVQLPLSGLPGAPSAVAAAPDRPVLVGVGTGLYALENGGWRRIGTGTDPAYRG